MKLTQLISVNAFQVFTIIRNIYHQNAAVTVDTEEHQAPTCSSTQTPQNKRKGTEEIE
jgi:hypothetical protein